MKNFRKNTIIIALLAALIISSGCEGEISPVIGSEASLSQIEISSESSSSEPESAVLPESSEPEVSEPETEEPEPIPEPVVHLSSNEVQKGRYITLCAENIDLYGCYFTDFLGYERTFRGKNGDWYCFIPIKPSADAGEYTLEFTFGDFTFSEKITVTERKTPTQYLEVSPKTLEETLEDAAVREAFDAFYQKYRWVNTGVALWNGEFVLPLGDRYYKETTKYGTFRTFSNGNTEWHNATDMAVAGGTPIYATNSGRILFAGWLGLTGNTVLIDHGYGIISWHYHMNKIDVSDGDLVEKGQKIGEVGTTGLSTGNHLHFGISVGGIFVDPMAMIGTTPEFDFWLNPENEEQTETEEIPEITVIEPETSKETEEDYEVVKIG
ncbi:MAG: M23 family metallopeptidase [Oscillospiraceae bacterium]|nr:M23 family metallopeptidase [Oscillospiraceae bacterium]